MDTTIKKVVLGAVICVGGFKSISTLIDAITPQNTQENIAVIQNARDTGVSQDQLDAILQGADPTEVFAPTAAGNTPLPCTRGEIELADGVNPEMQGHEFVSTQINDRTYIKVMPFERRFLVQRSYQSVSATEYAQIPTNAERQLQDAIAKVDNCEHRTLYLSSVAVASEP
ncbi:hypothetical protein ADIMK_4154 [Marinobacterium lacunae]|uniref:Uncharacterized protein n=1 Tax=Marinobacterium lacunae TaxID=1232683 RepID=A0A081FT42_9GAMM|nr:hypothetical protein [Marinobacterium lacunae]KEA61697.1 hypothetical protein ADIMK_4154 [Marinobacterium lacunae]